jgi:hypothetical protein
VKGSGIDRGFCTGCMSTTCGHPQCDPHIPWQARIDYDSGRFTRFAPAIEEQERKLAAAAGQSRVIL